MRKVTERLIVPVKVGTYFIKSNPTSVAEGSLADGETEGSASGAGNGSGDAGGGQGEKREAGREICERVWAGL